MKYIIFDLEATCWLGRPPKGVNEIIEIGAVKVNDYAEIESSFIEFVKPTINPILSEFCTKLTSIEQNQVDRAYSFPRAAQEFQDWIKSDDDSYTLISWGKYDKDQLISDCNLHNIEPDWVYSHYNLKPAYSRLRGLNTEFGLKRAIKQEGFEFTGVHHRAISDAENLAKIFIKFFKEWSVG